MIFTDKEIHPEAASNLVVPNGVTAKSDDLELAGHGAEDAGQHLPHQERQLQSGSGRHRRRCNSRRARPTTTASLRSRK